jgi:hypothetical protein
VKKDADDMTVAEGSSETKPNQEESVEGELKAYEQAGLATLSKAPISWVALFAAICGVTSLIPFYIYITGGGYISMGSGLFMPLAGQLLGPWAGGIASFTGGLIGMFLAPGAFPLGLIDVILSAAIIGLSAGLMARRWKWVFLGWWILNLSLVGFFPYLWPGQLANLARPNEPTYTLSWWYVVLAFVVWIVLGPLTTDLLHRWGAKGSPKKLQILSLILMGFIGRCSMQPLWALPYYYILRWPPDYVVLDNSVSLPTYVLNWIGTGLLAYVVFRALWRTRLRRVPGSLFEDLAEEEENPDAE